jgi:hypothetical protein
VPPESYRFSDQFISFTLVNIGGRRAENVIINAAGEFKRQPPRENLGERFGVEHAQMAPGQSIFLFRVEISDFWEYGEPDASGARIRSGNKDEKLTLTVDYNGPNVGLNRLWRIPSRLRSSHQYRTTYVFHTMNVMGDFPPIRRA